MGDVTGGAGGGAGGTNSVSSGDEAGPECQVGFVALGRLECVEGRALDPCGGAPRSVADPRKTNPAHEVTRQMDGVMVFTRVSSPSSNWAGCSLHHLIEKESRLALPNCVCRFWLATR